MSLPPTTRTHYGPRHAIITPEGHVRTTFPGWTETRTIVTISPHLGAGFLQYLAEMGPRGRADTPPVGVERFVFVLSGSITLTLGSETHSLSAEGYAFIPTGQASAIDTSEGAELFVIDRRAADAPAEVASAYPVVGSLSDVPALPFLGDPCARLQSLIPDLPGFATAMNVFTFDPGASLPFVESHYMEHGLIFLQGGGIYRLEDRWYPVQLGDQLWMGAFCPQWFAAVGREPARYLYYKNGNRNPILDLS